MIGLRWVLVAMALLVSGCANAPQIPLSLKQVQDLKVTSVEVTYAPDANIAWSAEEAAFAKSKGYVDAGSAEAAANAAKSPNYEELINSPQSKQHQKDLLAPRVKSAFDRVLAGRSAGTQPVKVVVVIKEMSASPDAQCVAIGGVRMIVGQAKLVDASGKTLASHDSLIGRAQCAGALTAGVLAAAISAAQGDPIDVMSESMAANFNTWLTPKVAPG